MTPRAAAASTPHVLLPLTLAWGVFAFGAPYPWAFHPLAAAAILTGALGLAAGWHSGGAGTPVIVGLAVVGVAIALQLVPVSPTVLQRLSPDTIPAVERLDPAFALLRGAHPVSIWPASTRLALELYSAFGLLMIGTAALLSRGAAVLPVSRLAILGTAVAMVGITARPSSTGQVYGFWTPQHTGSPFGPFVNHNHFAGWMLMAFPLAMGLLCARLASAMRGVKPGLRNGLMWASSPDASKTMLLIMAVFVMALSIVLSRSRSGLSAFLASTMLFTWFLLRGTRRKSWALAAAICVLGIAVVSVLWVGVDPILQRFARVDWAGFNHRRGAWSDAARVAAAFPLVGTGVNTYGAAMLLFQQYDRVQYYPATHNDYLQLVAEGGLLVSIPVACLVIALVWKLRRRLVEDEGSSRYWLRLGAVVALIAIGLQEIVEFSLQMPGNAAMFAVVCGIALHKSPPKVQHAELSEM